MAPAVLTQHNDPARSGANLAETERNWASVSVNTFGKLGVHPVDGLIYAQPLYVSDVNIPGRGTYDVVIVATTENWIYAFDARDDFRSSAAELWSHQLGDPVPTRVLHQDYNDIAGKPDPKDVEANSDVGKDRSKVGILSTPVIDAKRGIIYVVAMTWDRQKFADVPEGAFSHLLFALDLSTGLPSALPGGLPNPIRFKGTAEGTGYTESDDQPVGYDCDSRVFYGEIGSATDYGHRDLPIKDGYKMNSVAHVAFNSMQQLQRPGLLLTKNNVIYTAFGSHGDHEPYHGWVFAHDARTLEMKGVFCTTSNGAQGGIWQAGEGLVADDSHRNIYAATGNGDFGKDAFGECLLKLHLGSG